MALEKYYQNLFIENMPIIRIHTIELDNFKGVEHGIINFSCSRKNVPANTISDIAGIYGQNGSGKSSLIDALHILKCALQGGKISPTYTRCISKKTGSARMRFVFDLQYNDGLNRKAEYAFSIKKYEGEKGELANNLTSTLENIKDDYLKSFFQTAVDFLKPIFEDLKNIDVEEAEENLNNLESRVQQNVMSSVVESLGAVGDFDLIEIYDEVISVSGMIDGKKTKLQPIIDTRDNEVLFGPRSKNRLFFSEDKLDALRCSKEKASRETQSFIFNNQTMSIFEEREDKSDYFDVLVALSIYGMHYLYVIDKRYIDFLPHESMFPFYTRSGIIEIDAKKPFVVGSEKAFELKKNVEHLNRVMEQLVPNLAIGLKTVSINDTQEGEPKEMLELVSIRDEIEIPFSMESEGIKKIASVLSLIISVYKDPSMTVAIDEFDEGIFEFLLGLILKIIEESGKGQFIFTSHNLRPLEVLNKDFIFFTTTNPQNRYYQFKHLGATNNLRNTYYREILQLADEQDEELYNQTNKNRIIRALMETQEVMI